MLRVLAAYLRGDRQSCSMVRVPTPEEEDAKRIHRERENLVQERLRIENRIERDEFGDISLQEVMAARDCQD
jgi:transposase